MNEVEVDENFARLIEFIGKNDLIEVLADATHWVNNRFGIGAAFYSIEERDGADQLVILIKVDDFYASRSKFKRLVEQWGERGNPLDRLLTFEMVSA